MTIEVNCNNDTVKLYMDAGRDKKTVEFPCPNPMNFIKVIQQILDVVGPELPIDLFQIDEDKRNLIDEW